MLYFAYGSNMLSLRLQRRVASARPLGRAFLSGYRLRFDKRSWSDASGKARPQATGRGPDRLWGVVFEMAASDFPALDHAEGLGKGYRRAEVQVEDTSGAVSRTFLYEAQRSHLEPALSPFVWYRDLVLAGALEHALPRPYVHRLAAVPAQPDRDAERCRRGREILAAAGWPEEKIKKMISQG
ncbi:MAG: gamma-glutamylcyclotransferase family protein [Acidobacteriota bacterium]